MVEGLVERGFRACLFARSFSFFSDRSVSICKKYDLGIVREKVEIFRELIFYLGKMFCPFLDFFKMNMLNVVQFEL